MAGDDADAVSLVAWLAAYAVGLAVRVEGAPATTVDAVSALVEASSGDVTIVVRARSRLRELGDLDSRLLGGADQLLRLAEDASTAVARSC